MQSRQGSLPPTVKIELAQLALCASAVCRRLRGQEHVQQAKLTGLCLQAGLASCLYRARTLLAQALLKEEQVVDVHAASRCHQLRHGERQQTDQAAE